MWWLLLNCVLQELVTWESLEEYVTTIFCHQHSTNICGNWHNNITYGYSWHWQSQFLSVHHMRFVDILSWPRVTDIPHNFFSCGVIFVARVVLLLLSFTIFLVIYVICNIDDFYVVVAGFCRQACQDCLWLWLGRSPVKVRQLYGRLRQSPGSDGRDGPGHLDWAAVEDVQYVLSTVWQGWASFSTCSDVINAEIFAWKFSNFNLIDFLLFRCHYFKLKVTVGVDAILTVFSSLEMKRWIDAQLYLDSTQWQCQRVWVSTLWILSIQL